MENGDVSLKLSSIALITAALLPVCAAAQSLGDVECDVANLVQLSFKTAEVTDETCQQYQEAPKGVCGDKHIYPVMTGHPHAFIQSVINKRIADMAQINIDDEAYVDAYTEVKLNKYNLFSVAHRSQNYDARIENNQSDLKCATMRLDSGHMIGLEDVLVPDYAASLPGYIKKNLSGKLGAKIPKYVQDVLREQGTGWNISKDQAFYVSEEDLVLCFEEGALTERSKGTIEVVLSYASIQSLISKTGALAFAAGSKPEQPFVRKSEGKPKYVSGDIMRSVGANIPERSQEMTTTVEPDVTPDIAEPVSPPAFTPPNSQDSGFTCLKDGMTHRIVIRNYPPESVHACKVDYYKGEQKSLLWQSTQNKEFCQTKVDELLRRYETNWNWTCFAN